MRISLLQCFSVDTSGGPRMETAAVPIWLIGTTFQPRGSHPFPVKITFPFSQAAHVTRRGEEASLNAPPFLAIPRLRHTRHVCLGTFRHTYVPLMKNPVTMAEGVGDSDTNFRRSVAPPRRYRIYPVRETRNFDHKILHLTRASLTFQTSPLREDVNEGRGGISRSYRYEGSTIDPHFGLLQSPSLFSAVRLSAKGTLFTSGNLLTGYRERNEFLNH